MALQFHRYLDSSQFTRELEPLHAFRGEYVGDGLLESLEAARLLIPRIRVRYPDTIARRFWLVRHEDWARQLTHPVEQDGTRWDAAVDFSNALYRWQNYIVYGLSSNPLDHPEPRFAEFLQEPAAHQFERWQDMCVDVSNDVQTKLFDNINFESYYSTWQLLLASEAADAGVHMRVNLADTKIAQSTHEALGAGRVPDDTPYSFNLLPVHAARDFAKHERALDAVVWFSEERGRALNDILKGQGGRFRLNKEQSGRYEQATQDAVTMSVERFHIGLDDQIALIRFLSDRWSDWNREGRPHIADAYKEFLGASVILSRRFGKLSFSELRDRVGNVGGWRKPILDVIWPNWAEQEKKRVSMTLKAAMPDKSNAVPDADIDAFVEFLATEGLEAFFWRLKSFEDHALRGNEFALEGMKSDLQGMAVVVEHVAVALGGTETQLYEKFKQLWRDPDVLRILKRGDVSPLARQARLAKDWDALKAKINALRNENGGKIAADLIVAHRIRGGVHAILPEDDEFELQALFVGLMRAAVFSFVEVRRKHLPRR
jgi:hypothetical protein